MLGTSLGFMQTSHPAPHPSVCWQTLVPPAQILQSLSAVVVRRQHEVPLGCEEVLWAFRVNLDKVARCGDLV